MAAREGFARLRKILWAFSLLWVILCGAMFWSLRAEHTLGKLFFFVIVAAVPIGTVFGLLWVIEGFVLKKGAP